MNNMSLLSASVLFPGVVKKSVATGTKQISIMRNSKWFVFWQSFQESFDLLCSPENCVFNRCSLNSEKIETCKNWARDTRAATSDNRLKKEREKRCLQAGRAHHCLSFWAEYVKKDGGMWGWQENMWCIYVGSHVALHALSSHLWFLIYKLALWLCAPFPTALTVCQSLSA